jgi:hypothetical protein
MTYNLGVCSNSTGNTGKQKYCGPKGKIVNVTLTPTDASIATKVLALTEATWLTNINAAASNRWFPVERVEQLDPTQEDPVYQELDYGGKFFVRDGKLTALFTLDPRSSYNKNELMKLNDISWSVYHTTDLDKIVGWTDDISTGAFYPFSTDSVRFLPESFSSGSETELITLEIQYSDITEMNGKEAVLEPTKDPDAPAVWYPQLTLKGLKDLTVAVSGISATGATVTLKGYGGTPYNSAVAADVNFYLASAPTVPITVTTLTPSGNNDGIYTAVWASQTPDTYGLGLFDQPDATTQGVETPIDAAVVIS